ncbi:hypothetical protein ACHAXS_006998 [Conticribra weissflogii]
MTTCISNSSGERPVRRRKAETNNHNQYHNHNNNNNNNNNNNSKQSRHSGRTIFSTMAAMATSLVLLSSGSGSGGTRYGGVIGVAAFSSSPAGRTRSMSSAPTNSIGNGNGNSIRIGHFISYDSSNYSNNKNNYSNNKIYTNKINHFQRTTSTSASTSTRLRASAGAVSVSASATATTATKIAALASTLTGGLVSGSLHAIAGPDHLAALIPRCCGLPWHRAARVGAVWGLGHGVSATLLGMCGFLFKKGVRLTGLLGNRFRGDDFNLLHHAGSFMELAIGVSLIVIGLLGIKEARDFVVPDAISACDVDADLDANTGANDDANIGANDPPKIAPQSLSAAVAPHVPAARPNPAKRAVLLNGILHGFSWDGAPSLAPAVAISTWKGSLAFLFSYALGTMAAMTVATTLIGEGTRRASFHLDRPDLPRDLSVASSVLALVVGVVWCWLALK